ncbi:MAG: flavin reductase family protein [candidate division Zixibacteria bacterium]|nr:flavin reductase family protein [candidate division Zixibacteria bacterium]
MAERCEALTYGCYIVTTILNGRRYGMTCCWATQVDSDKIMLCLGKQSTTRKAIIESRVFGVSVLSESQKDLALRFGEGHSADVDKFDGLQIETGQLGVPLLPGSLKTSECEVVNDTLPEYEQLLIGRIVHFSRSNAKEEPLLLSHIDE